MKKTLSIGLILTAVIALSGCMASQLTTKMAISVGDGFIASADLGAPEMQKIIKSWPYISGQIKGIPHYEEVIPGSSIVIIKRLDSFAEKDTLSLEECGTASTDLVNIEYQSIQYGWDKYGVSITGWFKAAMGLF